MSRQPIDRNLHLEDLRVGLRFTSASHKVDERQIRLFASAFDPQVFHLHEEAARGSFFGGLAASRWHTAAITARLNVSGGLPIAGGIVGLGGEMSWPKPTRPGDVLHVESEVVEVVPSRTWPDRGTVVLRIQTFNQRGEVVQSATLKLLVPRSASSAHVRVHRRPPRIERENIRR